MPRPFMLIAGVLFAATALAGDAEQDIVRYAAARKLGIVANPAIYESSGLACSRQNAGVFWTHNDSGDGPAVYAIGPRGEDRGTFTVDGAKALDWEDMASVELDGHRLLVLGDIGDNMAIRGDYAIYIIEEPKLAPQPATRPAGKLPLLQRIDFTYEDGPRNAEGLAVDPADRKIYIVSKNGVRECKMYALAWPAKDQRGPFKAAAIATLKIPTTSGMDISPDGRRMVVLTYKHAWEWTRGPNQSWAEALKRNPRRLELPNRSQGESICYGPDGRSLYLTSEGRSQPLWEVPAEPAPATHPVGAGGRAK